MPSDTPTRQLAEAHFGQPLEAWVLEARAAGKSWRTIASDLQAGTDGKLVVSRETLRSWFGRAEKTVPLGSVI